MSKRITKKGGGQTPAPLTPENDGFLAYVQAKTGVRYESPNGSDMVRPEPAQPKLYRLTLTTADGEILDRWQVNYDIENADTIDLSYPVARAELLTEITNEIRKDQIKRASQS